MFENINPSPLDPIDIIAKRYKEDTNPNKLDLGVGVYRDENGNSPILAAVRKAESDIQSKNASKTYLTPRGNVDYCHLMEPMVFGTDHGRDIASVQTGGGGPALRTAAELINLLSGNKRIWLPNPTWHHQILVFAAAHLDIHDYPYYDRVSNKLLFDEMLQCLENAESGDVLLLHGCCHNPTGEDLTDDHWEVLSELIIRKELIPFVDLAYQGFGRGFDLDVNGIKCLAKSVPEMMVASTSSKSFSIYQDRAGMISILSPQKSDATLAQILEITRGLYFMPPNPGAAIVVEILSDPALKKLWLDELNTMRERMTSLRNQFSVAMNVTSESDNFNFIAGQYGMFSFLPMTPEQVERLANDFSVYMIPNGRINIAGLTFKSIDYVAKAICIVLKD